MSTCGDDAALSVYYRAFEIADLDPDPDWYQPLLTTEGATTPFAAPAATPTMADLYEANRAQAAELTGLRERLRDLTFRRDLAAVVAGMLGALLILSYLTH